MSVKYLRDLFLVFSLAALFVFILPGSPSVPSRADAQAGIMRWETINTPNADPGKRDVLNPYISANFTGSEIRDLAIGRNGTTLIAAVTVDNRVINALNPAGPLGVIFSSLNGGISWSDSPQRHLIGSTGWPAANQVYNVVIAPDDPKLWALTAGTVANGPNELWVTQDGGASWQDTMAPALAAGEAIGAIDISIDYGSGRDLLIATRSGSGNGRIFITKMSGFGSWVQQADPEPAVDYFDARFSPTYQGDSSVIFIYADDNQTSYNIGLRDISNNQILQWIYPGSGVEISTADNISPSFYSLAGADLSLPSDYSGMSAALRRAFVSIFSFTPGITDNATGIFRIDDSSVAALLRTPTLSSQVYSIDFFGTYSQGKLVAGTVHGSPCFAMVPTVYMDTPCTCAGSCAYVSLKPPTGAANQADCGSAAGICNDNLTGIGAAIVNWNPDGSLAYAATGSAVIGDNLTWWNSPVLPAPWITTLIPNDESALSISRNNGDTWNQLSLIDTTIDWFNDIAVSADCTTMYLASVHRNVGFGCNEFDSVWRYTMSPAVASPLPALMPAGSYWERVFIYTTSPCCSENQTDMPILRTVPSCTDSGDGGVVAWAAQYTPVQAWSPDYGDYWVPIISSLFIQDFTFESSRVIYNLGLSGRVQKLVYTGTAWTNTIPATLTGMIGHTIAARNGKVLVGAALADRQGVAVGYSSDSGKNWYLFRDRMPVGGNVHVTFDVDFENNSFIYAAVGDNTTDGTVYRNTAPSFTRWVDNDMMDRNNGADGPDWFNDGIEAGDPPHRCAYYGIVMAWTGNPQPALYAAHDNMTSSIAAAPGALPSNSGVCRTLLPRSGLPKPGIYWDCLDIYMPPSQDDIHFTLEPSSLKACGCCSANTNTSLFAIDDESGLAIDIDAIIAAPDLATIAAAISLTGRYMQDPGYNPELGRGMLWAYTDCLAKKGPSLKKPADQALVGADPVSGRNQQVDLSWEQLCLSNAYQLQVAKDENFTMRINPQISNASRISAVTGSILLVMDPVNVTSPAAWLAPASLPEAGAYYYWRVRSYQSATGQIAISPWSETRSFTVKPGFIVNSPYLGVQLLAPDNGCIGCQVKPVSFSWSPWKEATRYTFQLAADSKFKNIIKQGNTATTGYEYDGTLDYDTNYFWRVKAIEINGQPVPSDWSATFSLRTESAPAQEQTQQEELLTPWWVWLVIGTGVVLVIVTLALILRTRNQL
ncbi:MAG: hypothetical protein JXA01_04790 [Dehalococcoidia bacterium]|nr:hypothetical protein [Dehalococcoidia bacterium]